MRKVIDPLFEARSDYDIFAGIAEWLGSSKATAHPLHLVSPHPGERLHSQLAHIPQRSAYTIGGREPVRIHTEDAQARGIALPDAGLEALEALWQEIKSEG